jgi:predicted  nucleic acid-binding Zn-ribbon protein
MELLEIRKREKEALEKETQAGYKQRDKKVKSIKMVEATVEKEQLVSDQIEKQLKDLRHELKGKKALLRKVEKEYGPLFLKKGNLDADVGAMKDKLFLINKEYDDLRAEVDENKKRIEAKMRERDLLNKDVVLAEEKEREKGDAIMTLEGELKKLQNKIQGYKAEAQKLQKLIYQLEKDK